MWRIELVQNGSARVAQRAKRESIGVDGRADSEPIGALIPTGINQNPWAHFRRPIDMIFQG